MRYRIDSTHTDHLPICECGWRGDPAMSRLEALAMLTRHQHRAHNGDEATGLRVARSRARRHAAGHRN